MYSLRLVLATMSFVCLIYQNNYFMNSLPVPVTSEQEKIDSFELESKSALMILKAPIHKIDDLSKAISLASKATGISPTLITCIIYTESAFKNNAVSCKNYKGLMQTPTATYIYSDVDILHGARIFKDKLRISNGDYRKAMMLYKGGNNPVALKYADATLRLYHNVKRNI